MIDKKIITSLPHRVINIFFNFFHLFIVNFFLQFQSINRSISFSLSYKMIDSLFAISYSTINCYD